MLRPIIGTDFSIENREVGDNFATWNEAIGARTGTIVPVYNAEGQLKQELWCDDEALLVNEPQHNVLASKLAGQDLFGNVIVFEPGDIK